MSGPQIPIPLSPPVVNEPSVQPYYVRETQNWAVQQEHMRHSQALYSIGEYVMFCLMWSVEDAKRGYVQHCSTCKGDPSVDPVRAAVAETYKQPQQQLCPDCFGTFFEGGYKAQVIRPAILSDADQGNQKQAKGVMHGANLSVDTTPDFRIRAGDYLFRADGTRYQLRTPTRVQVRTGFMMPHQSTEAVGYNITQASLEDESSVAYLIPPTNTATGPDTSIQQILAHVSRGPVDFAKWETIRAPLIPPWGD